MNRKVVVSRKFLVLLLTIQLLGCAKDEILFIPDLTYSENREAFVSAFTNDSPAGIVRYSGERTLFQTTQGVFVDIAPNSLFLKDGSPVAGDLKIELQEITSQRKNLLKSPGFLTNTGCLECGKLLRLKITHQGQQLVFTSPVQVFLPSDQLKKDVVLYFHRIHTAKDTLWSPLPTQELVAEDEVWNFDFNDKSYECRGYKVQAIRSDEWYCIGQAPVLAWSEDSGKCIKLPEAYTKQNTLAFFLADQKNVFIRLDWDLNEACLRFPFSPVNESLDGKIIFLSSFGHDNIHFGMTPAVWNQEEIIIRSELIKPTTKKEIQIALSDL